MEGTPMNEVRPCQLLFAADVKSGNKETAVYINAVIILVYIIHV